MKHMRNYCVFVIFASQVSLEGPSGLQGVLGKPLGVTLWGPGGGREVNSGVLLGSVGSPPKKTISSDSQSTAKWPVLVYRRRPPQITGNNDEWAKDR